MARFTSFSRLPVGPIAPGSWPPWPASMATTSTRVPAGVARARDEGGAGVAAGGGSVGAGAASTGALARPVAGVPAATVPSPEPGVRPSRMSSGDAVEAEAGATGSAVVATAAACGSAEAIGAGTVPSPGQWIASRAPSAEGSTRSGNAFTGADSSKTMRRVPGTGWPVRTAATTPVGAGSFRLRAAWESGRSSTSRSGPARLRVLYWPAPCRSISARVPVAPCSSARERTSPAQAAPANASAASTKPTLHDPIRAFPWRMAGIQSPHLRECKYFSFKNPWPG